MLDIIPRININVETCEMFSSRSAFSEFIREGASLRIHVQRTSGGDLMK